MRIDWTLFIQNMYTFVVHTQVASLNIVRDANTILLEIVHLINAVY